MSNIAFIFKVRFEHYLSLLGKSENVIKVFKAKSLNNKFIIASIKNKKHAFRLVVTFLSQLCSQFCKIVVQQREFKTLTLPKGLTLYLLFVKTL